jgi:hypothetical protein
MSTEKQIAASQTNGKLGGVKTEEGKERSKMNAVKHGILSSCQTKFDTITFAEVYEDFASHYSDTTPLRRVLIEQLSLTYMRMLRCAKFESDILRESLNPPEYKSENFGMDFNSRQTEVLVRKNDKAPMGVFELEKIEKIQFRYENSLFRRFRSVVKLLEETK